MQRNIDNKYFIFSDVHGEFDILHKHLMEVGFDEDNKNHILFSLGDLFDRGTQNDKVLEYMLRFWEQGRFIGILGNHDEFVLEYLDGESPMHNIQYNGFGETLLNFAPNSGVESPTSFMWLAGQKQIIQDIKARYPKLVEFMNSLVDIITFDNKLFSHAGATQQPLTKRWEINPWARTDKFVKNMPADAFTPHNMFIFGHWGASYLRRDILKEKDHSGPEAARPFHYRRDGMIFIGIDGFVGVNFIIPILTMKHFGPHGWVISKPSEI